MNKIWPFSRKRSSGYLCPYCNKALQPSDVLFRCRNIHCRKPRVDLTAIIEKMLASIEDTNRDRVRQEIVRRVRDRTMFKPDTYRHYVPCPECKESTYLKICPNDLFPLPANLINHDNISIVGLRGSGKTCYMLSVIECLRKRLARIYRASFLYDDGESETYVKSLRWDIDKTGRLPQPTDRAGRGVQCSSVHIDVRMPSRSVSEAFSAVSLAFQDPSGEWFKSLDDVHQVNFLVNSRSIILLIDPYTLPAYTPIVPKPKGSTSDAEERLDPETALSMVIKRLSAPTANGTNERIPKELAVVLTKSDTGIFGENSLLENSRQQKYPYDPELANGISQHCRELLMREDKLNAPLIVSNAESNFAKVRYFAVSALGNSVTGADGRRINPEQWRPRRVEEPLLWILHEWGVI